MMVQWEFKIKCDFYHGSGRPCGSIVVVMVLEIIFKIDQVDLFSLIKYPQIARACNICTKLMLSKFTPMVVLLDPQQ